MSVLGCYPGGGTGTREKERGRHGGVGRRLVFVFRFGDGETGSRPGLGISTRHDRAVTLLVAVGDIVPNKQ